MKNFDTILVANRGEIAVRVIKSAKDQGYRTVAVYSEADRESLHVATADEAYLIGPSPVKESYLNIERIIAAAKKSGAQAIHPGYGFLSENSQFAEACEQAGIVFIGPSREAIFVMGNKAESKRRMIAAGVPTIPGYEDKDQSDETLIRVAAKIGVPLMVKAAAGGGGRGMRLVWDLNELPFAIRTARSEAENAFGSGELILERALINPRHVEVQVFGDTHGNIVHLGERDCSVQRRHQKVVEESPCPVMTAELRSKMGQAAIEAARSVNYVGAGTVEFLLDSENNFYFLEMNTRLQVEHPVTEMVTGKDLVALQFLVAQGKPLGFSQEDISLTGHAIEVRLYAEDPSEGFLPATGSATVWRYPTSVGVRVDNGLKEGQTISPFYDPMLAKIIAWGEDREVARLRLVRALEQTQLFGVENNRSFLLDILRNEEFAKGETTTAFIAKNFTDEDLKNKLPTAEKYKLAAVIKYRETYFNNITAKNSNRSARFLGWSSTDNYSVRYEFVVAAEADENNEGVAVAISYCAATETYKVMMRDEVSAVKIISCENNSIRYEIDDSQRTAQFFLLTNESVSVQLNGIAHTLINKLDFTLGDQSKVDDGAIRAPMHGSVVDVLVAVGDEVEEGQTVAVMEAMKMEHRLKAGIAGKVLAVHAEKGAQVATGAMLVEIA